MSPEEAPKGVVTLAFTDIQGSTRLWEHFGEVRLAVGGSKGSAVGRGVVGIGGGGGEGEKGLLVHAAKEDEEGGQRARAGRFLRPLHSEGRGCFVFCHVDLLPPRFLSLHLSLRLSPQVRMKALLDVHNVIMRKCLKRHRG